MVPIALDLFLFTVLSANRLCISQYIKVLQVDSAAKNRLSRAYNNPYHPEDDTDDLSDVDGDNLRYRKEDIEEKIKVKEELKDAKKLRINGKYYEVKTDDRFDGQPLGYNSE